MRWGIDGRIGLHELRDAEDEFGWFVIVAEVLSVQAGLVGAGFFLHQHRSERANRDSAADTAT